MSDCIQQQLMDTAHSKWAQSPRWSVEEFFFNLTVPEKIACAVGHLNYQVENGGFIQWHCNGYSAARQDLRIALRAVNSETSKKVLEIVNKAVRIIEMGGELSFGNLDDDYYGLSEALLADMDNFLKSLVTK